MKRFIYSCLGIVVFTSVSCTLENEWFPNTTVFGKFTDQCTGLPVGGITVTLQQGDLNRSSSSSKWKTIRTVTTSSDGYYEIKFAYVRGDYWIETSAQIVGHQYWYHSPTIQKKKQNELNFAVSSITQTQGLNLKIKNNSPFNNNDSIYVFVSEPLPYAGNGNQWFYNFKGQTTDTSIFFGANSCIQKIRMDWDVTKNNITNSFHDSVECTVNTISSYQINY